MTDIENKLTTYMYIGMLASEGMVTNSEQNREFQAKKVKYKALIPIGHRMKTVVGNLENSRPINISTLKDCVRLEVRNKHNTTISFEEVQIEEFEVLE